MAILQAVLDDYEYNVFDYGAKTLKTVKIYENDVLFAGAGYTGVVKISKNGVQRLQDITLTWTSGNNTGTFQLAADNMFASEGIYSLEVELQKSGEVVSTKQIDIYVFGSMD